MEKYHSSRQQTTIWQDEVSRLIFAELVNVFYTREITNLVNEPDPTRLKRFLKSLPYYVERAATHIVLGAVPLELDSHNGCWVAPQRKKPSQDLAAINKYYQKSAMVGLVVPIMLEFQHETGIYIDMIDQVALNKVHCNEFGWFNLSGLPQESEKARLLKPSKALMTAACCGHRWHYHKIATPRLLGLREMLLASSINWPNVTKKKIVSG
ncbi:hypothetical protein [Pseudoalteromonas luteoviolacea]|uniref:Uncharacterized protein n=1 Tax=Pseudoalteromonas luteoviolacea NCIMB 1942 TaxID=1365253 RepID=A0A162AF04_9GAMM|nr:hypothetical protein [Pseudoalteromonas luteoviolacea]KZN48633.1 hypothetical protein N482_07310 [Pseudoalteromonas luteoviolacea NCIMB 1942]KZX00703.1 hypothetical protein JL49_09315 [Pseudoalteromonas luteoviolacea]